MLDTNNDGIVTAEEMDAYERQLGQDGEEEIVDIISEEIFGDTLEDTPVDVPVDTPVGCNRHR